MVTSIGLQSFCILYLLNAKSCQMNLPIIKERLERHKPDLQERFHIHRIGVFGSYAKGQAKQDSDIDFVIELQEGQKLGFKESFDLERFLAELFNRERVDVVNRQFINPIIESEMEKSVIYV